MLNNLPPLLEHHHKDNDPEEATRHPLFAQPLPNPTALATIPDMVSIFANHLKQQQQQQQQGNLTTNLPERIIRSRYH